MEANRPTQDRSPWRAPARSWAPHRAKIASSKLPSPARGVQVRQSLGVVLMVVAAAAATFYVLPGPSFGQQNQGKGKGKGQGKKQEVSRPTPHWPDGHLNLGPLPGEKGLWMGSAGTTLASNQRGIDNPGLNLPA